MTDRPMPDTISFLLAYVCKAHRARAEALLNDVGLHTGQELFLTNLWEQDGQTQTELVEKMCVQPATISKMLTRMQETGLVERRPDPDDNRVSRVYLTARSRQLQEEVEVVWQQLEEQTVKNFSLEERVLLRRLLMQIHENLSDDSTP